MAKKEKSKFAPKRNEAQKTKDRELIKDLRLLGWTIRQIANHNELNHLSHTQVHSDLKKVEKEWKEKTLIDLDIAKKRNVARLDWAINECSVAWEKSKADKVKKTVKSKTKSGNEEKEQGVQTETISGDSQYIKRITEAIQEQNKMLGTHATVKVQNTNKEKIVISFKDD